MIELAAAAAIDRLPRAVGVEQVRTLGRPIARIARPWLRSVDERRLQANVDALTPITEGT